MMTREQRQRRELRELGPRWGDMTPTYWAILALLLFATGYFWWQIIRWVV